MRFGVSVVFFLTAVVEVARVAAAPVAAAVVDLLRCLGSVEQGVSGPMRGVLALISKEAVTPVAVAVVANAPRPFPALVRQANANFANEVLPRPGGPYDASH